MDKQTFSNHLNERIGACVPIAMEATWLHRPDYDPQFVVFYRHSKKVVAHFSYSEDSEIIYNLHTSDMSLGELEDLIDGIKYALNYKGE